MNLNQSHLTYNISDKCRKLADIFRERKVAIIVNNLVGGKATDTKEKVTDTEVKDEVKHWISHHTELLTKLHLDSLFEAAKINKGDNGDDITDNSNNPNNTNDRQHQLPHFLHCQRLTTELCPIGNETRSSAVWVWIIRICNKSQTDFICCVHVLPVFWVLISFSVDYEVQHFLKTCYIQAMTWKFKNEVFIELY